MGEYIQSAVIHPKAVLADDVEVDPIPSSANTSPSARTECSPMFASTGGRTSERCELHPFVSVGAAAQHTHYKGEPTKVVIGHG
ncbi:MAG: hypothetical protein U0231_14375 [Nitrospiraceae bacterium]